MSFAWLLFSSRASSSTQQAERALWEIRRLNIILQSQYCIVLSKNSSTWQICLRVRSKPKLINCDSFCPHGILTWIIRYLTNMNLLQLQLSDSNFRRCEIILWLFEIVVRCFSLKPRVPRYILLQFLILFQYLKSNVKFKTDTQVRKSHPLHFFPKLKLLTLNSSWNR